MKKSSIFFFLIFGQALLAQKFNGFYFEPLINVKTTIISKKDINIPTNPPYFELKPIRNITPIGFNVGLNLGYKFKNNNLIQIGIFQDESLSGVNFSSVEITGNSNIITIGRRRYSNFGGVKTKNINFLFKKELFKLITNKKLAEPYLSVHLNLGITYFYKPNNGLENLTGIDGFSYYSIDSNYVEFTSGDWVFPLPARYSFKYNIGLDFTFGNKKNEFFSLGIYYISNFSRTNYYSFSSGDVRVTDKNNITTSYPYFVIGRGNGLYYQISKRFYPFKYIYEKQQRKLNEINNKEK